MFIIKRNILLIICLAIISACNTTSYAFNEITNDERASLSISKVDVVFSGIALEDDGFRKLLQSSLKNDLRAFNKQGSDTLIIDIKKLEFTDAGSAFAIGAFAGGNKIEANVFIIDGNKEELSRFEVSGSYNFGGYTSFFDTEAEVVKRFTEEVIDLIN
tara:strand:- start:656 stop:1132 length:477 start_codon:yes stop_codon:yes gene_type:complete